MTQIIFTSWPRFQAIKDIAHIRQWLQSLGSGAVEIYKRGMQGPHSGRVYGKHRASSPGEYPAMPRGRLFRTIRKEETADSVTVGTSASYAIYLRRGTSKMKRRKMSDNAMTEAVAKQQPIGRFARFRRG